MKKESTETAELHKEIAKLKEELKSMKQIEVSKDQQISGLNSQLLSKNNEIASLKKPVDKSKDVQLMDKEKELEEKYKSMSAVLEQKINSLEMRITQLNHENSRIEQSNSKLTNQLKEKEDEINHLKQGGGTTNQPQLPPQQNEEEKKQKEEETTKTEQAPQEESPSLQYENLIKAKDEEIAQGKEQLTYLTNEVAVLTREKDNALLSLEEAKSQAKEAEAKMQKLKATLVEIKKKVEEEMMGKTAEINKANEKLFNEISLKNKNLEDTSKAMKANIVALNKEKTQFEEIVLKQEDKIKELTRKCNQNDLMLQSQRREVQKSDAHIQELMRIIKQLKKKNEALQITKEEMDQTENFQRQIDQLKIALDMKDSRYADLLKRHKILQVNYRTISSRIRMENTKQYLYEAKEMKKKRGISNDNGFNPKEVYNTEKDEEIDPNEAQVIPKANAEQINDVTSNNPLLYSNNEITPSVILPPLKMKTPSLLNMTNMSNEGEERKELNQMMSKIINEFQ